MTQKETNPFPYSDSNKRYYTFDYYLRRVFGSKCAKIPLDAGMTCPNLDGHCGVGGCIYCSSRGSGDFAESSGLPIAEQYRLIRDKLSSKWSTEHCIPYFQAHTNTYAPVTRLKELFEEAFHLPGAVAMNIATRADCLDNEVLCYLEGLTREKPVTLELGLQSSDDITAERINRGHLFADFLDGFYRIRKYSPHVKIGIHIILGLPGEDESKMMKTVQDVADLQPEFVKIHLLHVIKGTRLAEMFQAGEYVPLEQDEYIRLVVKSMELLPPETVIERVTGDGMAENLLAPLWSLKKVNVINQIDKTMFNLQTWQGKYYKRSI